MAIPEKVRQVARIVASNYGDTDFVRYVNDAAERLTGSPSGLSELRAKIDAAGRGANSAAAAYSLASRSGATPSDEIVADLASEYMAYAAGTMAALNDYQTWELAAGAFRFAILEDLVQDERFKGVEKAITALGKEAKASPSMPFASSIARDYDRFIAGYEKQQDHIREAKKNKQSAKAAIARNPPNSSVTVNTYQGPVQLPVYSPPESAPLPALVSPPAEQAITIQEAQAPKTVEEQAGESYITEFVTTTYRLKFGLRKNWWVFVGLAVGLYAVSVWRARQKRRQLQERF